MFLVKKDGTWHFCIDFCKVNAMTHCDAYPLPRIDETLDSLAHAFTTLHLASGNWQVELEESAKEKTAFWWVDSGGHYEFNVMPLA